MPAASPAFDPSTVADPAALGLDLDKLHDLYRRASKEIDEGLLPSCQIAVARDGQLVAFRTFGKATDDNRYVMYSCTKAVVAGAAWLLIGEGRLDPSSKVADHIPEFATNGKDVVTVEQVMLHTCGFPLAPLAPHEFGDREARLRRFAAWRLTFEPGTAFAYHATAAHWVLAELITRASGRDYREVIRDRITLPLGLGRLEVGVPIDRQGDVLDVVEVGELPTPEEIELATGLADLSMAGVTNEGLLALNAPAARAAGVPGGGGISRAAELALYYQALLHNPGGLWSAAVLDDATTNVRNGFVDPMTGVPANRSLGLVIAGDDGMSHFRHNFGRTVSPSAFGHSGAGGQIAWADPASGLSFAYLTNALDRNVVREGRRGAALSSRAGALLAV